eukprot:CAMPEP_0171269988 /NCGR_PEP_ID=MMETSP0790-20130122/60476_1 /TAXON_ID=2925 /ORGANISM="Alexandrium catenella, Strain OF101" /LENGTH=656 /DNA_ID=CAMNT_0011738809 /DNA_START=55 /DNA_END=2022 /DNA_ORIENTATION=+
MTVAAAAAGLAALLMASHLSTATAYRRVVDASLLEAEVSETLPPCKSVAPSTFPGHCSTTVSSVACYSLKPTYTPPEGPAVSIDWACADAGTLTDKACKERPWNFNGEVGGQHLEFSAPPGIYEGACDLRASAQGGAAEHEGEAAGDVPAADVPAVDVPAGTGQELARIDSLEETVNHILTGDGLWKLSLCITGCPELWAQASWRMVQMLKDAKESLAAVLGRHAPFSWAELERARPAIVAQARKTLRSATWTFLKAVDTAFDQRIIMGLIGDDRVMNLAESVGMKLTGLCVFQRVWAEMKEAGVEMHSPKFWQSLFTACPAAGEDLPLPFANMGKAFEFVSGMAFVVSEADKADKMDEEEEAKFWEGAPKFSQCVLKRGGSSVLWVFGAGEWKYRRVTVEKGMLKWHRDTACGSSYWATLADSRERTASLALLTQKPGEQPIESVALATSTSGKPRKCIRMANPSREFVLCPQSGKEDLGKLKEAMDAQLGVLGKRREALAVAAHLERLVETKANLPHGLKGKARKVDKEAGTVVAPAEPTDEELRSIDAAIAAADNEETPETKSQKPAGSPTQGSHKTDSLAEQAAVTAKSKGGRRSDWLEEVLLAITASGITLSSVLSLIYICDGGICLADPAATDKTPPIDTKIFDSVSGIW